VDTAADGRRRGLALWLMVSAQFSVILDFSIVNVALPTIQRSLRFSPVGVEGVITAYATAFGGALILGGRLADLLGRRRMFTAGLLAFAATSLACALAPSAAFLIVARAAQGLSAAVLAPAALSLLTTTFAEGAERNRALGLFGAVTAAGFVAGQILGGVLTDLAGWRSIFIINAPVGVLAAVAATQAVRADQGAGARRVPDIAGAVLITAAMALAVWAPAQGSDRGWTSADFLVPLAAAVILAAAFVIIESRRADPLIRLSMLRSRWMAGTSAATAVTGALNGVVVLLCTLFLQHVHGYSPLQAGLVFVPTGIAGLAAGTRLAGPLVTRFGVRTVLTASLLASAIGVAGLSLLQGGGSYLPLLPWLVIIGAAFTTAAVATTVAVSAGVAPGEQGMAAAIRQTAFQLGVALSVAVLLSVAASYTATRLSGAHPQSTESALTDGYRLALAIAAALAAVGAAVAAAALRPGRPRGQHPQAEAPHQPQAPALPDKAPASAPGPGHENGAAPGG
jgi:EmrB/QacA subfamily drug resistance transporter